MSKLDMIMQAFGVEEDVNDKSKKLSDEEVEEKAENMTDVAEVVTETKTDSDTTETIGGDE